MTWMRTRTSRQGQEGGEVAEWQVEVTYQQQAIKHGEAGAGIFSQFNL